MSRVVLARRVEEDGTLSLLVRVETARTPRCTDGSGRSASDRREVREVVYETLIGVRPLFFARPAWGARGETYRTKRAALAAWGGAS